MATRTPREVVTSIGEEYVHDYPRVPDDPETWSLTTMAFDRMAEINDRLFCEMPIGVRFQEEDPYDDYEEMRERVKDEKMLRVFSGGADHPIWDHHAEVTSRVVHDWYGHLELDVPFTPVGEYRKWEHARQHYPAYCDRVLFTEVIGQLGAAFYLDDGFGDDRFEQKAIVAPPEWIEGMSRAVEREKENQKT